MALRFPYVLLLLALLVSPSVRADVEVQAGDLLAVDQLNNRILHVVPQTGQTYNFSPRGGSGTNRLNAPNGIAIDPDGTVFVTNQSGELIAIDPVTGVQSVVHAFDILLGDFGPVDIGLTPRSLDISDYTASPSDRRDLYVLSTDGIRRIDRTATSLVAEIVVDPDATIANLASQISIVDDATGPGSAWIATPADAVLYDFSGDPPAPQTLGATIAGIDFHGTAAAGDLFYFRSFAPVSTSNGVFTLLAPVSLGGFFIFDFASITTTPPSQPLAIYVALLTLPPLIVAVTPSGNDYVQNTLSMNVADATLVAMAVSPAALPEPGLGSGALSAGLALAMLRERRARRTRAALHPAPART
jgi:hypothetical protein